MRKSVLFMLVLLSSACSSSVWAWGAADTQVEPYCVYTPEGHRMDVKNLCCISAIEGYRWIVVYSPHPDDETLGLGATINYYKRMGFKIMVVLLTHGEKSVSREILCDTYGFCFSEKEFGLFRVEEFKAAVMTLGAYYVIYDYGDQNLKEEIVQKIILYYDKRLDVAYHFVPAVEKWYNLDHAVTALALENVHVRGNKAQFGIYAFYYTVNIHGGIIFHTDAEDVIAKRDALYQYRYWNPAKRRYAIGYLTFPELWDLLYSKCEFEIILIIIDENPSLRSSVT